RARQMDFRDRAFNGLNYLLLSLLAVAMVYPFVYVLSASISSPPRVLAGDVLLLPHDVQLDAYAIIAQYDLFWIAYRNTIFYTSVGTVLNVVLTVLAAYPLSRRWFFGRGPIQFFIVFTMLFSGGLIPYYLVVRDLRLLDTPWAMIVPGAVSAWNL